MNKAKRVPAHKQEAAKKVVDFAKYRSLKFFEDKLETTRLTPEQVEKVNIIINEVVEDRATVKFETDGTIRIVETQKVKMRLRKKQNSEENNG